MKFNLSDVLEAARGVNSSDIHFKVGYVPTFRVEGILTGTDGLSPLSQDDLNEIIGCFLSEDKLALLKERGDIDTSFETRIEDVTLRYRVNVAQDKNGGYATLRLIPDKILGIEKIGFPNNVYRDIVSLNSGLVLVTGVTGSGKTTTLASIINEINKLRGDHIITLEDPIEYVYGPVKSIISQRELGTSLSSFGAGVKYALRQDPDVILIGEIRDKDTAEKSLEAAATGHLVLSTLHTRSADETASRYVNLFPHDDHDNIRSTLASTLAYVLSQQLIPYQKTVGRTLAMEVMNVKDSPAVQNRIRKGEYHMLPSEIQTGAKYNMIQMDKHLEELVKYNKIESEDAIAYARNPENLRKTFSS